MSETPAEELKRLKNKNDPSLTEYQRLMVLKTWKKDDFSGEPPEPQLEKVELRDLQSLQDMADDEHMPFMPEDQQYLDELYEKSVLDEMEQPLYSKTSDAEDEQFAELRKRVFGLGKEAITGEEAEELEDLLDEKISDLDAEQARQRHILKERAYSAGEDRLIEKDEDAYMTYSNLKIDRLSDNRWPQFEEPRAKMVLSMLKEGGASVPETRDEARSLLQQVPEKFSIASSVDGEMVDYNVDDALEALPEVNEHDWTLIRAALLDEKRKRERSQKRRKLLKKRLEDHASERGVDVTIIEFSQHGEEYFGFKIQIGDERYLDQFFGSFDELTEMLCEVIDNST